MFKYVNNNQKEDIFLIHGWATDYTIFDDLKIPYNYILIKSNNPTEIIKIMHNYCLKNDIKAINILGWSMGSFIAVDFLKKYSQSIQIKNLILLSACNKYEPKTIKNIRFFLNKNKELYLLNFYKKCFFDESAFEKFKTKYFDYYLKTLTTEDLFIGLDYLEKTSLDINFLNSLSTTNISIINSKNDQIISTLSSIEILKILKNCGHAFFLENFKF